MAKRTRWLVVGALRGRDPRNYANIVDVVGSVGVRDSRSDRATAGHWERSKDVCTVAVLVAETADTRERNSAILAKLNAVVESHAVVMQRVVSQDVSAIARHDHRDEAVCETVVGPKQSSHERPVVACIRALRCSAIHERPQAQCRKSWSMRTSRELVRERALCAVRSVKASLNDDLCSPSRVDIRVCEFASDVLVASRTAWTGNLQRFEECTEFAPVDGLLFTAFVVIFQGLCSSSALERQARRVMKVFDDITTSKFTIVFINEKRCGYVHDDIPQTYPDFKMTTKDDIITKIVITKITTTQGILRNLTRH